MKGSELKEILAEKGVVFSELSARLGLSPQGLMHKFTVKNVKPEFVHQVEEIVGFNVEEVYKNEVFRSSESMEYLALLKKKDEQIDRLISLLEQRYGTEEKKERRVG